MADLGACAGRTYTERGLLVVVERGWRGTGPRNVLIRRADGSRVVRPFRGLRVATSPPASTTRAGAAGKQGEGVPAAPAATRGATA